jgi:hypothetical protein
LLPCPLQRPIPPPTLASLLRRTSAGLAIGPTAATLDRWTCTSRAPKALLALLSPPLFGFILVAFACCSSLCKPRPPTLRYPSCGALLPTWYALPAKQPCYPNPPPLSHLLSLSLSLSLSLCFQSAASCRPESSSGIPATVAGFRSHRWSALCVVNVAHCRAALSSLPCLFYRYRYTLPSCLCPNPALAYRCCTSSTPYCNRRITAPHSNQRPASLFFIPCLIFTSLHTASCFAIIVRSSVADILLLPASPPPLAGLASAKPPSGAPP